MERWEGTLCVHWALAVVSSDGTFSCHPYSAAPPRGCLSCAHPPPSSSWTRTHTTQYSPLVHPPARPQVISTLKGHDDKVRVVLNKSDQVDAQQLMRVYGALMWSLGKVFRSPEVCRVYIGRWAGRGRQGRAGVGGRQWD